MNDIVKKSLRTLGYMIETTKQSKNIESVDVIIDDMYMGTNEITARIEIGGFCEDPDMGAFKHIIDKIDDDVYNVVNNFHFNRDGKFVKTNQSYLMCFLDKVEWEYAGGNLKLGYFLHQSEF